MYQAIGDCVIVIKRKLTNEEILVGNIILPEGVGKDVRPPDTISIYSKGTSDACKEIELGDIVLMREDPKVYPLYKHKQTGEEYAIVYASQIICRLMRADELKNSKITDVNVNASQVN